MLTDFQNAYTGTLTKDPTISSISVVHWCYTTLWNTDVRKLTRPVQWSTVFRKMNLPHNWRKTGSNCCVRSKSHSQNASKIKTVKHHHFWVTKNESSEQKCQLAVVFKIRGLSQIWWSQWFKLSKMQWCEKWTTRVECSGKWERYV